MESHIETNNKQIFRMLHKLSFSVHNIPPLFVQLNVLQKDEKNHSTYWKEKARWIRFEEHAEDVLGRWSKPYVSTVPYSAIESLKELIRNGSMIFDTLVNELKDISVCFASELSECLETSLNVQKFVNLFCSPNLHHHEKPNKITNGIRTLKRMSVSHNIHNEHLINEGVKRNGRLSHTEFSLLGSVEDNADEIDHKENRKFKKKINRKAEGASILIMPVDFVNTTKLIFLRLKAATKMKGFLEINLNTRFIVLIIGSIKQQNQLYEIGRALSTCLADDICRELFYTAQEKNDLIDAMTNFSRSTLLIPPSEWDPKIRIEPPESFLSKEEREKNPELSDFLHEKEGSFTRKADPLLKNTLLPFHGLFTDLQNKIEFYISDFTDYFNLQCFATTVYIYLVSLCTLVIFGGLFGAKTNNLMATIECIVAGSLCSFIFSLFGGQPLVIITATGPVLILENLISDACTKYGFDFMELRAWIGIWTSIFLLLIVIFNLSFLVKYITRFTEDCFASLVSVVFIIDAIKSIVKLKKFKKPKEAMKADFELHNSSLQAENVELLVAEHNSTFYFSMILFIFTFVICIQLKDLRNKPYFSAKIKQTLSDFAVIIAITITSLIDLFFGYNTLKLNIPTSFQPTRSDRSWLIPLYSGKNPPHAIAIAIVPAILATILIFMDQQITGVIANRKEFKLRKSHGYHLDLFIISISILICSLLGLPWLVAATVLTLSHINSLKSTSEHTAPGEKHTFIGIREQRGTTLISSILLGLSIFFTPILSHIPMACLFGVFLFMGINTLEGIQFVDRILIMFMPPKNQPDFSYLRYVSTKKVHLFTVIQMLSLGALFLIKYIESIAICFPLLIVGTCGVRKMLDLIFTQRELFWLDDLLPGSKLTKKHIIKQISINENENEENDEFSNSNHENDQDINDIENVSNHHQSNKYLSPASSVTPSASNKYLFHKNGKSNNANHQQETNSLFQNSQIMNSSSNTTFTTTLT